MQETAFFKLSGLLNKSINAAILQNAIIAEIYKMDFRIFLSPYFKKNGGVVEGIVEVENFSLNDDQTGAFQVTVNVNTYNACLVIDAFDKEKLDITFAIDENYNYIKMTGPLWLEREPDEI